MSRELFVSCGKASHQGLQRENNQDSLGILQFSTVIHSQSNIIGFYLLADGMGGHADGKLASHLAVSSMLHYMNDVLFKPAIQGLEQVLRPDEIERNLKDALFFANAEICRAGKLNKSDPGTTITAMLLVNGDAYLINAGDSRAYAHSAGNGLHLITLDHSLVYRMYLSGQIEYNDIPEHYQKNQLLCALGDPELRNNLDTLQKEAEHPFFFNHRFQRGEIIVLCTDGIWETIRDAEIEEIIKNSVSPQQACNRLIEEANKKGGFDNSSVIVIKAE